MRPLRIALLVGAAALLLAVAPWPHGYYVGLRFLICAVSTFAAYVALREGSVLVLPFVLAGIVFNPILPAQMTRSIWIAADLVVATGFLAAARWAPLLAETPPMDLSGGEVATEPQTAESS